MADKKTSKRLVKIAGNHENITETEIIQLIAAGKLKGLVKDIRSLAGSVRAQYAPQPKKNGKAR